VNPRLDPARLYDRILFHYRAQIALLAPAGLLVFIPVAVLNAVLKPQDVEQVLVVLLSALATYVLQGMAVEAVRDLADGRRDSTLATVFGSVLPVLGSLVFAGVLVTLGVNIGLGLLLVPGLILMTLWAVVAPVVVVERLPALYALTRSRELVRGNAVVVFSVVAVTFLAQFVVWQILGVLLDGIDTTVAAVVAPLVVGALVAPLSAIAATVLYVAISAGRPDAPVVPAADAEPAA
jgi:hypothetical protein